MGDKLNEVHRPSTILTSDRNTTLYAHTRNQYVSKISPYTNKHADSRTIEVRAATANNRFSNVTTIYHYIGHLHVVHMTRTSSYVPFRTIVTTTI